MRASDAACAVTQQPAGTAAIVRDASLLHPLHDNTISGSLLFGLVFGLPAALTLLLNVLQSALLPGGRLGALALERGTRDVHHLMLAVLQAYALASCWKIWLNVAVGRQRPDWYARVSSGDASVVDEGRMSYPSGHAAYSHGSGAVCAWYLAARLRVCASAATHAQFARLMVAAAPVGLATAIAATRLTDYRHHFSDVNAGAMIGTAAGSACYFLHFAPDWAQGDAQKAASNARVRARRGRWAVEERADEGSAAKELGEIYSVADAHANEA